MKTRGETMFHRKRDAGLEEMTIRNHLICKSLLYARNYFWGYLPKNLSLWEGKFYSIEVSVKVTLILLNG